MKLGEYSQFHYHNTVQYLDDSAGWEIWFPETNNRSNRFMRLENQINNFKNRKNPVNYKDNLPEE